MSSISVIILGIFLAIAVAGVSYVAREQRRLLREIRKLAALYPPYPVSSEDGTEQKPGTTSVWVDPGWNEDVPPRS